VKNFVIENIMDIDNLNRIIKDFQL